MEAVIVIGLVLIAGVVFLRFRGTFRLARGDREEDIRKRLEELRKKRDEE